MFNGVELKWSEPAEARKPSLQWRFHVFKGSEQLGTSPLECVTDRAAHSAGGVHQTVKSIIPCVCVCLMCCVLWYVLCFLGPPAEKPLHVHRQSAYLIGRDRRVADLPIDHPSCSGQHAVLQYRQVEVPAKDGEPGTRLVVR